MKILIISHLDYPTPYEFYAPIENQCFLVAGELARRNHDVSLIALKGSKAPEGVSLIEAEGDEEKAFKDVLEPCLRLKEFECILDFSHFKWTYVYKHEKEKNLRLIGCVHPSQRYNTPPPVPFANFFVTSEAHGVDVSRRLSVSYRVVPYGIARIPDTNPSQEREYALYLGRFESGKGAHLVVDIAHQLRMETILVGEDASPISDQSYVINLLPKCDGKLVKLIGRTREDVKKEYLSKAKVSIFPYLSDESAFTGLSMLECLSYGIPVIAFRRGMVPELISHGVDGFIAERLEEVAEYVKRAGEIDRVKCVEKAKQYTMEKIGDKYEALLKGLVNEGVEW